MNLVHNSKLLATIGLAAVLVSCGQHGSGSSIVSGEDVVFRHAHNIKATRCDGYTVVTLTNPWDTTRLLHRYVLVGDTVANDGMRPDGTVVRTPLSAAVVFGSTQCGALKRLKALPQIKGVCDLKYIRIQEVVEAAERQQLKDLGDGMNPDVEQLITLHPDGLMVSPFENSGGYGRMERLGIPIVECADYMEATPLGRAEWIRFYGMLFGKEALADSLFAEEEQRYMALKSLAMKATEKPTLLCETKMSATWYVSGGKSYMGQMYADAGADYLFADYEQSGSVALSFETVYERAHDADVWVMKYNSPGPLTYTRLAADLPAYKGFKAYKERKVWACNTYYSTLFDDFPYQPHLLLQDYIKILHPDLLPDTDLMFFHELTD
ncbi:MAG: ABC transporter substrate-binding protein [Bacteroidales bacterium]|nr:ABC transporter substrate-binding protein [Bacteroidales bacterium]